MTESNLKEFFKQGGCLIAPRGEPPTPYSVWDDLHGGWIEFETPEERRKYIIKNGWTLTQEEFNKEYDKNKKEINKDAYRKTIEQRRAKQLLMSALDEAGLYASANEDAKSILMQAFDEAGLFAQDEWTEEDEAQLTDSERANLAKHDKARHGGHFDPKTMTCKFREKIKEGAKIEELKDEVDDPDIIENPDKAGFQEEMTERKEEDRQDSKIDDMEISSATIINERENESLPDKVTPEMDKAYMEAVEQGNWGVAADLVKKAAAIMMKDSKIRNLSGNLRISWHGTPAKYRIREFDTSGAGESEGTGAWFTFSKKNAETYTAKGDSLYETRKGHLDPYFLNLTKPYIFDAEGAGWDELRIPSEEGEKVRRMVLSHPEFPSIKSSVFEEGVSDSEIRNDLYWKVHGFFSDYYGDSDKGSKATSAALRGENGWRLEWEESRRAYRTLTTNELVREIKASGKYDGVIIKNCKDGYGTLLEDMIEEHRGLEEYGLTDINYSSADTTDIIVFNGENIKSARIIETDNYGNIIPLSKRFDMHSKDVRGDIRSKENISAPQSLQEEFNKLLQEKMPYLDVEFLQSRLEEADDPKEVFRNIVEEEEREPISNDEKEYYTTFKRGGVNWKENAYTVLDAMSSAKWKHFHNSTNTEQEEMKAIVDNISHSIPIGWHQDIYNYMNKTYGEPVNGASGKEVSAVWHDGEYAYKMKRFRNTNFEDLGRHDDGPRYYNNFLPNIIMNSRFNDYYSSEVIGGGMHNGEMFLIEKQPWIERSKTVDRAVVKQAIRNFLNNTGLRLAPNEDGFLDENSLTLNLQDDDYFYPDLIFNKNYFINDKGDIVIIDADVIPKERK